MDMDIQKPDLRPLLGQMVHIEIDRPVGYHHGDIIYPLNYGYVPGLLGGDSEEQDAYILGIHVPLSAFDGTVIGIIHRHNDYEDKLVVAPKGMVFQKSEIIDAVHFQEQFFITTIESLFP